MSTAASRRKGPDPAAEPPGARRRGRPPKGAGQGEADLLAAAARAFSEHGFEGATLRGIAAAARVDPALIAYRYGGKTALWRAVIEDFAEQVEAALDAAGDAADRRLAALVDGLAGLACRRPELVRLILRESTCAEVGERAALIRDLLTRPIHARLLPLVAAVEAARPEPDRADPEVRLFALLGAICMVLATRPSLAAFTDIAADEARLRDELRRSLRLSAGCAAAER
ncbi:TetR/AcrR family transcriptional regulator [Amaricoccus sp.]|uniref:TetR/AcrR family transcriptional regulator n=1 Tax=Amaricoccus sp. TaxID=1872485 RepID=UPI001B409B3E|nr:TetR family transcriptional regulator [Amaricoccus sp.]MBP7002920.1 helix-turn-helix transcriptional regulator [Amaricoccus sp.]